MNVHSQGSRIPERRNKRKAEAAARNAETAKLSTTERLARLDQILGKGIGAKRERKRLQTKLVATPKIVVEIALIEEPSEPGEPLKLKAKDRRARDKKTKEQS